MMTDPAKIPTLDEIKANLLEVRNHTQFNIGSPAAIDHLLISIVTLIDVLQAPARTGNAADPDCECCFGGGLQADGETPCPCTTA